MKYIKYFFYGFIFINLYIVEVYIFCKIVISWDLCLIKNCFLILVIVFIFGVYFMECE